MAKLSIQPIRTVKFRDILWGIAYRIGMDPRSDLLSQETYSWAAFINLWIAKLWDKIDFPEWTLIEQREPNSNHEIHYDEPGLTPIGKVLKVYLRNPRLTRGPLDTPFRISAGGIHVGFEHGTSVWLKFMLRPPEFTAVPFDPTKLYETGDLVYEPVLGECFIAGKLTDDGAGGGGGGGKVHLADAGTNSDASLTSATAGFTANDVGALVTGSGIPPGTIILSVTNDATVVLSLPTTSTAANVVVTLGPVLDRFTKVSERSVADAATTNGDATLTSATAVFTADDVGATVAGTGIPAGAYIKSVTNATTVELSGNATSDGTAIPIVIAPPGGRWRKIDFPFQLAEPVIRGAYADAQRAEDQTDKALAEEKGALEATNERGAAQMGSDFDLLTDQVRPAKRYQKGGAQP